MIIASTNPKKMLVNTDAKIINKIDMADGFQCFAQSNYIKKNQKSIKKKKIETFLKTCHIDGKYDSEISLIASISSVLDDLNQECEDLLTFNNT